MSSDPELLQLRAAVDATNRRLVDALHDRARLCRTIGRWKQARGLAAEDPAREAAMLDELLRRCPADGMPPAALATVLRAVFAASRALVADPTM